MNPLARSAFLFLWPVALLWPVAAVAVPDDPSGNASCQQWVDELVAQMADPASDVRLRACRAARSWKCGSEGPGSPGNSSPGGAASNEDGDSHKLQVVDVSLAPDPFSPEPDTFLDFTTLAGVARIHATDSLGSSSPFEFELRLSWSIEDLRRSPVREIESVLPVGDLAPGEFFELPFQLVWNGAVGTQDGPLASDGDYGWKLVAELHRLAPADAEATTRSTLHGRGGVRNANKLVASVALDGTITIDGSLGEALRADLEESLLARLDDPEIPVRRASLASLAIIGREMSVAPLIDLMRDDTGNDPLTRGLAAMALGGLVHVTSDPDLILTELSLDLAGGVDTYRALVARAFGRTHDLAAVPQLEAIRADTTESDLVRGAADQAVNRIERMFLSQ